jgi:hypothetical protein
MSNEAEHSLRAYATKRGLRVRRRVEVFLGANDPAVLATNFSHDGRQFRLLASSSTLVLICKAALPVFFSVGQRHPTLITTEPVAVAGLEDVPPIFVSAGFQAAVQAWLRVESNRDALRHLDLREHESLHAARNDTMFVFRPNRRIGSAVDALINFANVCATDAHAKPTFSLPEGFADLETFAHSWAIHDDDERELAVKRLTAAQRATLRRAIVPRLKDIDRYLDDYGRNHPLTDPARRLQALGELGAELARDLSDD